MRNQRLHGDAFPFVRLAYVEKCKSRIPGNGELKESFPSAVRLLPVSAAVGLNVHNDTRHVDIYSAGLDKVTRLLATWLAV